MKSEKTFETKLIEEKEQPQEKVNKVRKDMEIVAGELYKLTE